MTVLTIAILGLSIALLLMCIQVAYARHRRLKNRRGLKRVKRFTY